jgi:phosphoglycerate dehydrogenase-like enzyme
LQLFTPISVGELIDKITILKIKQEKASDEQKLANINRELSELETIWEKYKAPELDISDLIDQLTQVNAALWDIEDGIRAKEAANAFDLEFIQLARSVYKQNDRRAALKKEINVRSGSTLVEEKLYQKY